jgi:monoamine oxidase
MRQRVVVVGGGIAGLTAALELSNEHTITVLEARERFGGRIHTIRPAGLPHELGAEFVHGCAPEIWRFIKSAGLETHEVPDRHWLHKKDSLIELPDFWDQLSAVTGEIQPHQRDTSFARLLSEIRKPAESIKLARDFIEGFHAAPAEKASIQAMRLSEESSEQIDGQRALRITDGFGSIVRYVEDACRKRGVRLRRNAGVVSIDWSRTPIKILLESGSPREITADRLIITLPIGPLRSGAIKIIPQPASKIDAIHALQMGIVTKVILQFRHRFWPEPNFGFIHGDDEWFSTCWADERGDILTAWAGGPAGDKLSSFDTPFIQERALETASKLFGESLPQIREALLSANTHNWKNDPYAQGAYSYIPVNGVDACRELARPEGEALFFAGEATDLNYQFGTVHGAIASGIRAARDLQKVVG